MAGALALWPLPRQLEQRASTSALANDWSCTLSAVSPLLDRACARYQSLIKKTVATATGDSPAATIGSVHIRVRDTEPHPLGPDTDEAYNLTVTGNESASSAFIESVTVFGALRGLETFSQLVTVQDTSLYVAHAVVVDSPRFRHREMLVDTARYYLDTSFLRHTMDAMAYSKLNILHWHAIDSQSFPVESSSFPQLAARGAFKPKSHLCPQSRCTYSADEIQGLVEYGHDRGIRLVLEVDTPGHSKSWGEAFPNLTVPLRPSPVNPFATEVVSGFLFDMLAPAANKSALQSSATPSPLLVDPYIHLGGDEVDFDCWEKDAATHQYLTAHNLTAPQLMGEWLTSLHELVGSDRYGQRTAVMWEEAYNSTVGVTHTDADTAAGSTDTVYQVWKDTCTLRQIADAGHDCLLSAGWYVSSDSGWEAFYDNEPFAPVGGAGGASGAWSSDAKARVLGGGVSKWGCSGFCPLPDDATKFDEQVWPVAAAVAERLWSMKNVTDHESALARLTEHRFRLIARGVHAGRLK